MPDSELGTGNTDLLKKIRQRYRYAMEKWRYNREEGQKNMRYVAGDPWTEEDKQARKGRPTVCPDELNQYVNQVVNTARQNPRGVKIDPAGDEATEELAEYRENRIRAIEYACNAAQVYVNGLQAAVERNIGFWKVSRTYVSDDSDEQEIIVLPVQNPDMILIDPDYRELDGSDIKWAFEFECIPVEEFEIEYPKAEKRSFAADDFGDDASYWFDGKDIVVAVYSEVQTEERKGKSNRSVFKRTSVKQWKTNGVEILESSKQPGPYLPIIPVFGKELWVDMGESGGGGSSARRVLISLVSLARDPQKALAYVMSSMLENCGQIPKSSYVGAVGQFETDKDAWNTLNSAYHPYLQYDVMIDGNTGQPMPPPQRVQLTPDFQAYSIGADVCRRAIQAAMGITPLPTAAQRQNQKSGVALSKIQSEQAIGSYHLVDSYDRAIKLTGRIMNLWLSETDLGETTKPVRLADGKHKLVKINTDEAVEEDDHTYHFPIADDKGRYQVTISSGPSHESQREEGSEFVDILLANLKDLPPPGSPAAKIMAIGIRIKQLGPLGDQMADIIDPQSGGDKQQIAQMQQQALQQGIQIQEMQKELQKLMLERAGKVIEMQGRAQQQALQHQFDMTEADKDREVKLTVAEIGTKAQIQTEREGMVHDLESQFHDQAHDVAMNAVQHGQAQELQAQQGEQQSQQSVQDVGQAQAALQPEPTE